ncbi:Large neutral amino acids transporter small subunit 2 [Portunus trituberculatus]|uniref:Large neutral amino acids transporter small subunit 2 n=1 Tax=Portunus trituberculatus TaxID=210409 RepID=A0A5B7D9H4_PORTR|nr:Large neutral amino acids transporter small subunit 2 [Portunus trituberculatus]
MDNPGYVAQDFSEDHGEDPSFGKRPQPPKDEGTEGDARKIAVACASSPNEPRALVRLKKELGLLEGITMIMGIVIGSGIFVSPKGVISYVGSVGMSLAVWAACGLLSMLGAICFAELELVSVVARRLAPVVGGGAAACIQGEAVCPHRNLPLAIICSTSLVTVIYTLTNAAYLAVLTPTEMISSDAVAVTFAGRTLGVMAWIMPAFVICSTFGSTNGAIFTQSRLFFVGARKGQFPEAFALVHADHFTPVPAIALHGVGLLLMLVTTDMVLLITYSTYAMTLTNLGCMFALFWFRYNQPDRPRPFKVWLGLPVVFSVIQVFLLVLPAIQSPLEVGVGLVLIASGLPVYYFAIYRRDIAEKLSPLMRKCSGVVLRLCHQPAWVWVSPNSGQMRQER